MTLTEPGGALHDTVQWTSSTEGVSLNRVEDGVGGVDLSRHDQVQGAVSDSSAGHRVDGTAW
jgi:hypothetical protein